MRGFGRSENAVDPNGWIGLRTGWSDPTKFDLNAVTRPKLRFTTDDGNVEQLGASSNLIYLCNQMTYTFVHGASEQKEDGALP